MAASQSDTSNFREKLVCVNRTAAVVKGGRRFSFSALVVTGDGEGRVGFGLGKAIEVPHAIQKATEQARRNMVYIQLKGGTLYHQMKADFGASKVVICPATEGTGIIAGGAMRAIFEVLGVEDVLAKCIGSSNPMNVVRATIKALLSMVSPEYIAKKRGKTVPEIFGLTSVVVEGE